MKRLIKVLAKLLLVVLRSETLICQHNLVFPVLNIPQRLVYLFGMIKGSGTMKAGTFIQ